VLEPAAGGLTLPAESGYHPRFYWQIEPSESGIMKKGIDFAAK
jgi:hypothetical protein